MTQRCPHDTPGGVSAWQHDHGQRCYWCWLEAGMPLPERVRVSTLPAWRTCIVRECGEPRHSNGLCHKHDMRQRRAS